MADFLQFLKNENNSDHYHPSFQQQDNNEEDYQDNFNDESQTRTSTQPPPMIFKQEDSFGEFVEPVQEDFDVDFEANFSNFNVNDDSNNVNNWTYNDDDGNKNYDFMEKSDPSLTSHNGLQLNTDSTMCNLSLFLFFFFFLTFLFIYCSFLFSFLLFLFLTFLTFHQ